MGKLIYSTIASLDGYISEPGKSDWGTPDEEVHAFFSDLERPIATRLYGRRMYETMVFWETASTHPDEPPVFYDYAELWQASEKIVYSRTLQEVTSARTRIEREFDQDTVRALKGTSDADMEIAGAELAGQAFGAGLVDECHLSCARSRREAASAPCRTTSACNSNFSTSAGSKTASFISTTA